MIVSADGETVELVTEMMATSIRNSAALKYFHNQCTYPASQSFAAVEHFDDKDVLISS
jgi:hypothetical protein